VIVADQDRFQPGQPTRYRIVQTPPPAVHR
jgi:hypothetical protein